MGSLTVHILRAVRLVIASLTVCLLPLSGWAQEGGDSAKVRRLQEIRVETSQPVRIAADPSVVQTLTARQMANLPTLQLSDALKYMSGVVVRDYGGTGGMKTVSVRGLGSQHTGVAYDGIPLSDCQTGQIDLGKLSLDNVGTVSLTTGVSDNIFVPASLLSHSSLLSIRTFRAVPEKPVKLKVALTTGAYGLVSPQVAATYLLRSKKDANRYALWNISASYMHSTGDYPYVLHYGGLTDSASIERRQNSDVSVWNAEANMLFQLDHRRQLFLKAYYYDSERGLPSATVYYNLESAQRLWNRNAFAQLHYHDYFNPKWAWQINGKFNYDHTHYFDPEYLNSEGFLDNHYRQYEGFVSNVVQYTPFQDMEGQGHPTGRLRFTLSNDLIFNILDANTMEFVRPARFTSLTGLSFLYNWKVVSLNGTLLLTTVNNLVRETEVKNYVHLSPALGLSVQVARDLKMRAFYKNIFRMPTFNDLYYREVGNLNLQPEKTHQMNVGLVLDQLRLAAGRVLFSTSVDGYFNVVKDKIVAFPTRNLFSWTMLNYGKVYVMGAEWNLRMQYQMVPQYYLHLNGNCTYQKAVDRTDPFSKTFNHQIPYTPKWSGSAGLSIQMPWLTVTYSVVVSGKRYALGQNIPANEVAGYVDHSVVLGHDILLKDSKLGFKFELLNLSDKNYEVIRNYPMQGQGFRFKIQYEY